MPNGFYRSRVRSAWLSVLIASAALLAATLPGFPAQDSHIWKTYTNERFGFSVCYPFDLLHPEPAPDNNDGRPSQGVTA